MLVPSNSIIGGQPAIIGASNALMYNPTTHTQAGTLHYIFNISQHFPKKISLNVSYCMLIGFPIHFGEGRERI